MQKITPFLWFEGDAEEAMKFYTSVFKNSKILHVSRQGGNESGPRGGFTTGTFQLEGQEFMAISLNADVPFKFTEAVSLFVHCETQDEIDYFWNRLTEGGSPSQCGWLKDKFGLSWQIVPAILSKLMNGKDAGKSKKVMDALLKMTKLIIADLEKAAE